MTEEGNMDEQREIEYAENEYAEARQDEYDEERRDECQDEQAQFKPCPFCGSTDVGEYLSASMDAWVDCHNPDCATCGPDTVEAWNIRPLEDAKDARIAELRAKALRLISALAGYRIDAIDMTEVVSAQKALWEALNE